MLTPQDTSWKKEWSLSHYIGTRDFPHTPIAHSFIVGGLSAPATLHQSRTYFLAANMLYKPEEETYVGKT